MPGKLIDPGKPRHYCEPPGRRERKRLGVEHGAVWACDCGKTWDWNGKSWYRRVNWAAFGTPKFYDVPSTALDDEELKP